jgi:hypothetical protein
MTQIPLNEPTRMLHGTRVLSMRDEKDEALKAIYSALLWMGAAAPNHTKGSSSSYIVFLKDAAGMRWHTMEQVGAESNISRATLLETTTQLLALAELGRGE